jgi:glycerol kinase
VALVLALDQGTTSSRAIVFGEGGEVRGSAQREFPQLYPRPGWVEHDPMAIWESQLAVAREALAAAGASGREIAAIGIANQRETALLWDRRTGEPVCNAIVWQDRRTAGACERLIEGGSAGLVRGRTGLEIDAYFSATKLAWLLEHVPGARARAGRGELAFGTVDAWLVWKLTGGGVHATDVSNASRTMLFDIHRGAWDEALLGLFGIPREVLPKVRATDGGFGEAASAWLGAAAPIRAVMGDQQAALLGQGCVRPGMVKCTYGTGCFLLMHTGTTAVASKHRLLTTVAWKRERGEAGAGGEALAGEGSRAGGEAGAARGGRADGRPVGGLSAGDGGPGGAAGGVGQMEYALEGSVFAAGAVVQWLRDGLGVIRDASEVEALARRVPDSGGVVFVPALTGLGAPHWDPHARGTISGITRGTTAAHIARAALEGIAQQVADVVEAMGGDAGGAAGARIEQLRVDGGGTANLLLMQMQADCLRLPVVAMEGREATALGAALAAGVQGPVRQDGQMIEPREGGGGMQENARARWAAAVERVRG